MKATVLLLALGVGIVVLPVDRAVGSDAPALSPLKKLASTGRELRPGIYKTEPSALIVVVPPPIDDRINARRPFIPAPAPSVREPDLRFIPRAPK